MKFFLTILFLLIAAFLFAEKIDSIKHHKIHPFSIELGLQQRSYLGDKYIHPYYDTIISMEMRIPANKYYGFFYNKNISWHLSIMYYFKLNQVLKLNSGVAFINRKTILTSPSDTVIKYQIPQSISKYIFQDMYFEIPLFIELFWKKFNFDIGGSFSTWCVTKNYAYSIDGSKIHLFNSWEHPLFYPAFKLSYEYPLTSHLNLRIYNGIEYLSGVAYNTNVKSFDFRLGTALLF